jgi:hypothetical protein
VALVLANPAIKDFADGHGIDVVQLFTASPDGNDKVCVLKFEQVFGYRLPCHVEVFTELAEGKAVIGMEPIKQPASSRIGERFKHLVLRCGHSCIMQLFGCIMQEGSLARVS